MISTAITRLFPLPNSPSGSASVGVNTETSYKFIDGSRECATALATDSGSKGPLAFISRTLAKSIEARRPL